MSALPVRELSDATPRLGITCSDCNNSQDGTWAYELLCEGKWLPICTYCYLRRIAPRAD